MLVPDSIPAERMAKLGVKSAKLVRYPGLKEEYYLAGFEPDPAVLDELGLDREKVLVVVRPPPETSEYHARNDLYGATIERLAAAPEAQAVVIPRTEEQGAAVRARGAANLIVPERAIDAQSLIAFADLVVSAGGTMNREAVALGTPVFTTFSGRMGGVDEALIAAGRLQVLDRPRGAGAAQARRPGRGPASPRSAVAGRRRALAGWPSKWPTTTDAVLAFVAAAAIAWLLVPYAERLALRVGAIDQPKARGLHDRPMPRLSGLAILAGVEVGRLDLAPRRRREPLDPARRAGDRRGRRRRRRPRPLGASRSCSARSPRPRSRSSPASGSTTSPCPSSAASNWAGSPTR